MITTLIIVVLAALGLIMIVQSARRGLPIRTLADASAQTQPVDMEAFTNLLDVSQQEYVRGRLSAREYAWYQRERSRVLIEYVERISHNSAVLIGLAHQLRSAESDAEFQRRNNDVLGLAIRTRTFALLALALLHISARAPWLATSLRQLAGGYQAARQGFDVLELTLARIHATVAE